MQNENTYWNKRGKHQAKFDQLHCDLVPNEGFASTEHGELLRMVSNVYYDVYNNGGCNLDCGRKPDWNGMVYLLSKIGFATAPMNALMRIKPNDDEGFSKRELNALIKLMEIIADFTIEHISNSNPSTK